MVLLQPYGWLSKVSPDLVLLEKEILWIFLTFLIQAVRCSESEINRHLELGKKLMAKQQYADALTHYHAAVELDPSNFMTLYRRATIYLALGRSRAAIPDLDRVIELKPDFISAHMQRGSVLLKQGSLDEAENDFKVASSDDSKHEEAISKLKEIREVRQAIQYADEYFAQGSFDNAEYYYTKAIESCQWYPHLHERRATCYQQRGDVRKAIADLRAVSKMVPDNTAAFLKISKLYYSVGDPEESLSQIRECKKLDPDHKECTDHYKKVRNLVKMRESLKTMSDKEKWMDCVAQGIKILKFEKNVDAIQLDVFRMTSKCNLKLGHTMEAIQQCTEVLKHGDPNDLEMLLTRAEAYLENEQYDEAIEDYKTAKKHHDDSRRAREGLNKAEKLKKQAGRKDYYKILGVKRNAKKREILKAYRKLAAEWHPDNFHDEKEKKAAEKKFIDIAAAKEVLGDDEKRQMYDNGNDPLDPENQQGGFPHGFNPFTAGFNPFGDDSGPFSFKFNFG
ncbi:hypothetical protein AB6A40_002160 [Gnathostoma spinigerum]|uniref:J domain-containing protein n=1 Tax=Gnathostoma spinigerum TaxID=75299 RepID=A0ABD6E8D9_9BILA